MGITPLMACEREVSESLLEGASGRMSPEIRQIARLKDQAIEAPSRRKAAVKTLEQYMAKYKGTRQGQAAQRAISLIITVSMLEVLQG